jgi:hypothetical protein
MKRDLELIKEILLHFESKEDWKHENLEIQGYEKKLVDYHLQLMYEGGLLNCEPITSEKGRIYNVLPFRLTWSGHEFLDNIREQTRWNKIKGIIKEKGGAFSIEIIKNLALRLAEKQLLGS